MFVYKARLENIFPKCQPTGEEIAGEDVKHQLGKIFSANWVPSRLTRGHAVSAAASRSAPSEGAVLFAGDDKGGHRAVSRVIKEEP